jgi:hypothetical protein
MHKKLQLQDIAKSSREALTYSGRALSLAKNTKTELSSFIG